MIMHWETKMGVALKELERQRERHLEETRILVALATPATRPPLRQTPARGPRLALARVARLRFLRTRREDDLAEAA